MSDTASRLLRLLSLLQTHRRRTGAELADELEVTTRTVRRDIDRLRCLGYPVEAVRGVGGYRLGAGAQLPPLLLDDDEAVAVVIGLRTAASSPVAGIEDSSLRALAKLEQVLPAALRQRVRTLQRATSGTRARGGRVDPEVLLRMADAIARNESLRFDYVNHGGEETVRLVEPHSLVNWTRRWYLIAWDRDRSDWRSFRADRIRPRTTPGPAFTPRQLPGGDPVGYLDHQLSTGPWALRATVVVHEAATTVAERIWPGMGVVEPIDGSSCHLHLGAESADELAWLVTAIGAELTVTEPPELVDAVRALGRRCGRAVPS